MDEEPDYEEPVAELPALPGQLIFQWDSDDDDDDDAASAPPEPVPPASAAPKRPESGLSVREATAALDSESLDGPGAESTSVPSPTADSPATEIAATASDQPQKAVTDATASPTPENEKPARRKRGSGKVVKRRKAGRNAAGRNAAGRAAAGRNAAAPKSAAKKSATGKSGPRKSASAAGESDSAASRPKTNFPSSEHSTGATTAAQTPTTSLKTSISSRPAPPQKKYHEVMESISLKWGARLPKVGFGFWKVDKDRTAEVCRTAIEVGYRHLDCACDYGNEVEVGQGIAAALRDGICDREDLWVTSKLWNTYHAAEHVRAACEKSLQDLKLDYLDLYLIHFPIAQRFVPFEKNYPPGWFFDPDAAHPVIEEARVPVSETWQAMEELAKSGLVRNIGLCNFGTSQIRDLLTYATIRPAVLQVETHPYLTQEKLLRYCNQEKIAYTAFSPLGAQSYFSLGMADPAEAVLQHPVIQEIAAATKKTAAQVLLRWGVQRGTAVIPKTSHRERMEENIDIFDFQLSEDQMKAISALDQGRRFNDPGDFGEAAFNTFLPIYE